MTLYRYFQAVEEQEKQIWDYDPALDSPKSFGAFSIFLRLGLKRTAIAAWRVYSGKSTTASGAFQTWMRQGKWAERAIAFDEFQQVQATAALKEATAKYEFDRIEQLKMATIQLPKMMARQIHQGLTLNEEGQFSKASEILSNVKLAAAALSLSTELWAQAVSLQQVSEAIQKFYQEKIDE